MGSAGVCAVHHARRRQIRRAVSRINVAGFSNNVAGFGNNVAGFGNNVAVFGDNVERNFVFSTKSKVRNKLNMFSLFRLCRKDEMSFDIVAKNGNNVEETFDTVERIVQLVAFDSVATTLLLVWTGLYGYCSGQEKRPTVTTRPTV